MEARASSRALRRRAGCDGSLFACVAEDARSLAFALCERRERREVTARKLDEANTVDDPCAAPEDDSRWR